MPSLEGRGAEIHVSRCMSDSGQIDGQRGPLNPKFDSRTDWLIIADCSLHDLLFARCHPSPKCIYYISIPSCDFAPLLYLDKKYTHVRVENTAFHFNDICVGDISCIARVVCTLRWLTGSFFSEIRPMTSYRSCGNCCRSRTIQY